MRVYVCTATGQNTINLIPLLEEGQYHVKTIDKIIVIQTIGKKTNIWFENLMVALEKLKEKYTHLEICKISVSDFRSVGSNIVPFLMPEDQVIFNIGGGIKSLALNILLFAKSIEHSRKWEIIYPSFEEKALIIFLPEYKKIKGLCARIDNEMVLSLYGHKHQISTTKFKDNLPLKFNESEFRNLYYEVLNLRHSYIDIDMKEELLSIINKIMQLCLAQGINEIKAKISDYKSQKFESISQAKTAIVTKFPEVSTQEIETLLPKNIGVPAIIPVLEKIMGLNNIKNIISQIKQKELKSNSIYESYNLGISPQDYFEYYATKVIGDYLNQKYLSSYVSVEINYKVISKLTNRKEAQHDLLLTLNNGQLISFDAKTMVNDHQTILSRIKSLENVAGVYTSFICVIPYYWNDFKYETIKQNKYLGSLFELPFYFKTHNITFCVISDEYESYSLTRGKNGIQRVSYIEEHLTSHDYVPIISFIKFIDNLF